MTEDESHPLHGRCCWVRSSNNTITSMLAFASTYIDIRIQVFLDEEAFLLSGRTMTWVEQQYRASKYGH